MNGEYDMGKPGRPSIYTDELASEICYRLASGESLRTICRDDHMPDESTVRGWAVDDVQGFFPQYTRAREIQADVLAEETIEIADSVEVRNPKIAMAEVRHAELRVGVRQWYISKVAVKKYGDKQQVEVNSKQTYDEVDFANMTTGEIRAYVKQRRDNARRLSAGGSGEDS